MVILITGLVIFFGLHFFSAFRSRIPDADIKLRMGAGLYMGLFALASALGLALMIWGYGLTRPAQIIYLVPTWGRSVAIVLMLLAMVLFVAAHFPRSYLKRTVKHPMLLAVIVWSIGHLLANGELNSILLFGSFLIFALIDRVAVLSRFDKPAADAPALLSDGLAILIGAGIYVAILLWLHPILFGVAVVA